MTRPDTERLIGGGLGGEVERVAPGRDRNDDGCDEEGKANWAERGDVDGDKRRRQYERGAGAPMEPDAAP